MIKPTSVLLRKKRITHGVRYNCSFYFHHIHSPGQAGGFAQTIIKLLAWTAALVLGVAFTKDVAEILMSTPFSTDINNHLTEMTASGTFDISQYMPDFIGGIITSHWESQNHLRTPFISQMPF